MVNSKRKYVKKEDYLSDLEKFAEMCKFSKPNRENKQTKNYVSTKSTTVN